MFYTYVIESLSHPDQRYIGHTADLKQRLVDHNAGKYPHTSKFVPWKIKVYVAFETIEQAQHFEKYLKSGSGHVFALAAMHSLGKRISSMQFRVRAPKSPSARTAIEPALKPVS